MNSCNGDYNEDNIFFKIINGVIPCNKIIENQNTLSFYDVNPKALIHLLVIPKNNYKNFFSFQESATFQEKEDFWNCVQESVKKLNLQQGGFRIISNCGQFANQEVPHFHVHILGGQQL